MSPMFVMPRSLDYRAFLVRLARQDSDQPWQIVAKDIETGEEFPCADLEALMALLAERMAVRPAH